ncbi:MULTISPECIES: DNRLRE domain-containing protein [Streptomyces]|uniref:DNRLRE domain-containing protein n=1 Tax=Streptomyces TaxID=1883 RepID=UPI00068ACF1E|nr:MULTISPECIES: DNRLRE domain-containing protein [Streptomyces]
MTGQAAAAPAPEDTPASAEATQPSKAEILQGDLAWAAAHAKGSKAWAILQAKETGKKVVVTDETTADSVTVANPDGTLTTEMTPGPERVWRGGTWRTVDATWTKAADGSVKAKEHPGGLRLAGKGGTVPASLAAARKADARDLITLGTGDESVTLQWKGGLPEPDLDGTTARYRQAVPGADLVVEATRTGFEQFVEIHQRPDGAYSYTLPVKAKGLKAKANDDGSVTFTDAMTGAARATMPAPVMWDASVDKASGEHTRRARVDMKVLDKGNGRIDLVITPGEDFLNDPKTQYPVTVDPSTSALAATFDTYVQQGETVDWSNDVELDFGNPETKNADGTPRTARSFITWNTTPIQDALIVDTNLALWNFHSGNTDCSTQSWTIGNTSAPSTASRWTDQPTWTQYHSSAQTRGNPDCAGIQPDGWINADVDALVQTWASAKATRGHMGLRAATDDVKAWKRVNSGNAASNQPKLSVTYNYRPSDGTNRQAGAPFKSYAGVWAVNTTTPTLRDTFTDQNGDTVNATFQVYDAATNTPITTPNGEGLLVSEYGEQGKPVRVTVPAGQLRDGRTYKFRTNAYDGTHYNLNWSPWTQFVVDTTAPGEPQSITSATYPENWGGGGAGVTGTFDVTTGTPDAYEVRYRLDPFSDDPEDYGWSSVRTTTATMSAGALAPDATYAVTPSADGNHAVQTRTVDRAGNAGPIKDYGFTAGNRDYNRAQRVDIALPPPDRTAADPAHNNSPIDLPADPTAARNGSDGASSRTFESGGSGKVSVKVTPLAQRSKAWRKVAAAREDGGTMTTQTTGPVISDKSICDPDKPNQRSVFTRDAACKLETWTLTAVDPSSGGLQKFMTQVEVMLQVQVDRTSDSGLVEVWVQMTPLNTKPASGYFPFFGGDSIKFLGTKARCGEDTGGCVEQETDITWAGDEEPVWDGNSDTDVVSGNVTHKWNGSLQNESGKKDIDLSKNFPVDFAWLFTSEQELVDPGKGGSWEIVEGATGSVSVRCDKVYATHGCVLPDYVPGYKFNAAAYPAASAHAWLIQNKAKYKSLGASPDYPLNYIPGPRGKEEVPSRPGGKAAGYNKNDSRDKVMCPRSGSKRVDGSVPKKRFLNHPFTFLHSEFLPSGRTDSISCDEYPFAATYQSPGMPETVGGVMPAGANGGGECVQTAAVKADDGSEHLVDDTRYDPPTWEETCGRSSMSNAVNGGSMNRMAIGTEPFLSSMRMLDKDAFWVDPGNEWFAGCDTSALEVKCRMEK